MCRNIKKLRYADRIPTDEELRLAALQFVRKVSGYRAPSRINEEAFSTAVEEVAVATRGLFDHLEALSFGMGREPGAGTGAGFSNGAVASNR